MREHAERPQGTLVAVGGNESKGHDPSVLRAITRLPEGGTKTVEIVATASEVPDEVGAQYLHTFERLDVPDARVLDVRSREQADDPDLARRVRDADVVFFAGGDQLRLTMLLGGTRVHEAVREKYVHGGVVAGTSAGAAAMSGTMIYEGAVESSLTRGNVQMTPGLGLLPDAVVDTHLIHRGRLGRLLEVVTGNPGLIGLGLGEDTGVVVRDGGAVAEVLGSGVVVVVDGHGIGHTNITALDRGEPIAVEGVLVHTLAKGYRFDLRQKRFLAPDQDEEEGEDA